MRVGPCSLTRFATSVRLRARFHSDLGFGLTLTHLRAGQVVDDECDRPAGQPFVMQVDPKLERRWACVTHDALVPLFTSAVPPVHKPCQLALGRVSYGGLGEALKHQQ